MTGEVSSGFPPFSRLFVIGDKKASEEDYKTTFSKFGKPISITFIKDRAGENKGEHIISLTHQKVFFSLFYLIKIISINLIISIVT